MRESKKQLKHTINYKDNDVERELYHWVENKAKNSVFRSQDIIKDILYKSMQNDNNKKD